MKLLLALLLALLAAMPASADESDDTLQAADARWNALRLQPDLAGLADLLVDDWLLTHSDGRVQDKADYLAELSTRTRANQSIENREVVIRRYGNLAVVTGTSVQSGVSNGQPWNGRFRFTRTWLKRDDRWQMVASHSSRVVPQE